MSLASAKAKLDAQGGDPVTGYISKTDHKESYDELLDDTALTGATTAEAVTVSGAVVAGTVNGRDPDDLTLGPASATDNALVRFDGTGGKTVQNSGITVDDSNNVSGLGTVASGAVTSSAAVQAAAASGFVVGSSGPRIMSGTGSPEGVVSAPVGSTWIRTDGATLGDFRYSKQAGTGSTGWVVSEGDTRLRNIVASLENGWTASGVMLRRVGRVVSLYFSSLNAAAASSDTFYTLPAGFRVAGSYTGAPYLAQFYGGGLLQSNYSTGILYVPSRGSGTHALTNVAMWLAEDAWPSSLPGSAA